MSSTRTRVHTAALVIAALAAVAGCSSSHHSTPSGAESSAQSAYSAVATSPAVLQARQRAIADVIDPCKGKLPSIHRFDACAEGKLGITGKSPEAVSRRGALEVCIIEAAAADHFLTGGHAAHLMFLQVGAPDCISQQLPPAPGSSTVSPSASTSSS